VFDVPATSTILRADYPVSGLRRWGARNWAPRPPPNHQRFATPRPKETPSTTGRIVCGPPSRTNSTGHGVDTAEGTVVHGARQAAGHTQRAPTYGRTPGRRQAAAKVITERKRVSSAAEGAAGFCFKNRRPHRSRTPPCPPPSNPTDAYGLLDLRRRLAASRGNARSPSRLRESAVTKKRQATRRRHHHAADASPPRSSSLRPRLAQVHVAAAQQSARPGGKSLGQRTGRSCADHSARAAGIGFVGPGDDRGAMRASEYPVAHECRECQSLRAPGGGPIRCSTSVIANVAGHAAAVRGPRRGARRGSSRSIAPIGGRE